MKDGELDLDPAQYYRDYFTVKNYEDGDTDWNGLELLTDLANFLDSGSTPKGCLGEAGPFLTPYFWLHPEDKKKRENQRIKYNPKTKKTMHGAPDKKKPIHTNKTECDACGDDFSGYDKAKKKWKMCTSTGRHFCTRPNCGLAICQSCGKKEGSWLGMGGSWVCNSRLLCIYKGTCK